ncbi:uncharacterized protein LOC125683160 [Ostrea edulis]|uniref:uncharacterized protein LOC125683160 n=1 Tax=Ostrea edulis TaxID=37623 RepID=UPI0024AFFCE0|nr:uncharacterized protein LOC125683160 [Ostrea edulis]
MKIFLSSLVLACFVSAFGRETCISDPPKEEAIDGETAKQSEEIQFAISKALAEDAEVNVAVNALIAERRLQSPEKKPAFQYIDTCPKKLNYITGVKVHIGLGDVQKCYVVHPFSQRVTYASCSPSSCYEASTFKSRCIRTGWTRLQFWVWCPKCGFKLIARWYPQCCSCYRWKYCFQEANEELGPAKS